MNRNQWFEREIAIASVLSLLILAVPQSGECNDLASDTIDENALFASIRAEEAGVQMLEGDYGFAGAILPPIRKNGLLDTAANLEGSDESRARETAIRLAGVIGVDNISEFTTIGTTTAEAGPLKGHRVFRFEQQRLGIPFEGRQILVKLNAEGHADLIRSNVVPRNFEPTSFDASLTASEAETILLEVIDEPWQLHKSNLAVYSLGQEKYTPALAWKIQFSGEYYGESGTWVAWVNAATGGLVRIVDTAMSDDCADFVCNANHHRRMTYYYDDRSLPSDCALAPDSAGDVSTTCQNPFCNPAPACYFPYCYAPRCNGCYTGYPSYMYSLDVIAKDIGNYYYSNWSRHGYNNNYGTLKFKTFPSGGGAKWYSTCKNIGFDYQSISNDGAAHEFTHAVHDCELGSDCTNNIISEYQKGAVAEHVADVVGIGFDTGDWTINEDSTLYDFLRDFSTPEVDYAPYYRDFDPLLNYGTYAAIEKPRGQPTTYDEYYNLDLSDDSGGVHVNNGILNKYVYLTMNGGSFGGITLGSGLGRQDTVDLVYNVLTMWLIPSDDFYWYSIGMNQYCNSMYGSSACSVLRKSAAAVGLASQYKDWGEWYNDRADENVPPAAIEYNDVMYLLFKDKYTANWWYRTNSDPELDSSGWSPAYATPVSSYLPIDVAVANGLLYVFHTRTNNYLAYSTFNGSHWPGYNWVYGSGYSRTNKGPAVTEGPMWTGDLVLAYKDYYSNNILYREMSSLGYFTAATELTGAQTDESPTMTGEYFRTMIAYKNVGTNTISYLSCDAEMSSCSSPQRLYGNYHLDEVETIVPPRAVGHNWRGFITHRGPVGGSDNQMYFNSVDFGNNSYGDVWLAPPSATTSPEVANWYVSGVGAYLVFFYIDSGLDEVRYIIR